MDNKIAFFHPSKEFGGAENLIIRLSKDLISRGYGITIIDFTNGAVISKLLDLQGINFIEYEIDKPFVVKNVTHLISFSLWIERIRNQLKPQNDFRILIWVIHPYHIFDLIHPLQKKSASILFYSYIGKITRMLELMNENGGLKFMDFENFFISKEYFKFNFNPEFLQIPIIKNNDINSSPATSDGFSLAWIGRLSLEKVNSLIFALDQVRKYSIRNRCLIHFYIVGSGSDQGLLDNYQRTQDLQYLKIVRIDGILPEEIPGFLKGKKLLFAMGTSALEGGNEKIPTVLLDYSYCDYEKIQQKDYKFKWLHQTKDYKLGSDIFKSYEFLRTENNLTIDDIFEVLSDPSKIEEVGLECYNYSIRNHSMEVVTDKLLYSLESDKLTFSEFSGLDLKKNLFEFLLDKSYNYAIDTKKLLFNKLKRLTATL